MGTARFCLLGPLEVRDEAGRPVPLGGEKPRELLAILLLHEGETLSVDRLVTGLWGESPSEGAVTTLRSHVSRVRKVLADAGSRARLSSRLRGYRLDLSGDALDAREFELLVRDAGELLLDGDYVEASSLLDQALGLWRGEVLHDITIPELAVPAATGLSELRLVAWEGWLEAQLATGRHHEVVAPLQRLMTEHPFRERFVAQLMLALYRSGRQAEALSTFKTTRHRLNEELGLDPGPELRHLEIKMLCQDPDLQPDPHRAARLPATTLELLERDSQYELLESAVVGALDGRGAAVSIAGEAGTGKTSLLGVMCAAVDGFRVLRGHCDPLTTPRPLGPFRDLDLVKELSPDGQFSLPQTCEEVLEELTRVPTLLVIEDLHWADSASIEVLRFVVPRVESIPLTVVLTFRDLEVDVHHPARPLLGDIARLDGALTLSLGPLSLPGVASLLAETGLDAARVHAVTGGNPFFVSEVAKEPELPLPRSVRDAVLARTADLAADDFEVLQLLATAPHGLDDRAVSVLGIEPPTLRRLDATTLVVHAEHGIAFRHELARQAIEATTAPGAAPGLHARILEALERLAPSDPAVLTEHAVGARDSVRAVKYATEAAMYAARSGSHSESAAFFGVALDHLDPGAPPAARAGLLQSLAFQQYMTSRLSEAIANIKATFRLWKEAGDLGGLAAAHETVAIFEYYSARRGAAETHVERARAIATECSSVPAYGRACSTEGFLAYLRSDPEAATKSFSLARQAADDSDDDTLEIRTAVFSSANDLARSGGSVRHALLDQVEDARSRGLDELASTGYTALVDLDVEQGRYQDADRVLDLSLAFANERDIVICQQMQTAVRARLRLTQGRWDEAQQDADEVLNGPDRMPVAALWPYLATALGSVRRGEGVPTAALDDAWSLAQQLNEPVRSFAVLSALAEVSWTTGALDPRTSCAERAICETAAAPGMGWAAGNLVVWLRRLGIVVEAPHELAEPYQLMLVGRAEEAAAWFRRCGDPFAEAMAWGDSPDSAHRARALRMMDDLGALGTSSRLRSQPLAGIATGPWRRREKPDGPSVPRRRP